VIGAGKPGAPSSARLHRDRAGYSRSARTALALLALALAPVLHAQQPTPAKSVRFDFDRPGLPVPKYSLTISADGSAAYKGVAVSASSHVDSSLPAQPFAVAGDHAVISNATLRKIFSLAKSAKYFNMTCASKAKNIADTGNKTLTYAGPDGAGACTYNYTENNNVQALTEIFQGIAETLDEGRQLEYLQRYDRLGLDAAIAFLAQEVSEGRALELGTIAGTLQSLAGDAQVMQRVRTRANTLLGLIPDGLASASVPPQP
jgi:hypothetical protein